MRIDTFVFGVMEETATSVSKSFDVYWSGDVKNDPPERNLSVHFCHVLLNKGFYVYAEADHPHKKEKKIQGIDILAISPDRTCCFACEFKAYSGESMIKSLNDLERVATFHLNKNFAANVFGQERIDTVNTCTKRYGIVAGLLWRPGNASPDISTNNKQKEFSDSVRSLDGRVAAPILEKRHEVAGKLRGSYYLYHAVLGAPDYDIVLN